MGTQLRRQCEICGAKSSPVDVVPTDAQARAVAEFESEHSACSRHVPGWSPADATSFRPDGWVPPQTGAFGSPKPPPRSVPRPHGHGHYTGPYGEEQEVDTISCCHCRRHVEVRAGTLDRGGFCSLCYGGAAGSGWTCGHPDCLAHVPYEVRLDNADAGRPALTPPAARAAVPDLPPGFSGAVLLKPAETPDAGPAEAPRGSP